MNPSLIGREILSAGIPQNREFDRPNSDYYEPQMETDNEEGNYDDLAEDSIASQGSKGTNRSRKTKKTYASQSPRQRHTHVMSQSSAEKKQAIWDIYANEPRIRPIPTKNIQKIKHKRSSVDQRDIRYKIKPVPEAGMIKKER